MARTTWVVVLLLAGTAAAAAPASAQDWRPMPVHEHDHGFVDADSVVRRDGTIGFRAQIRQTGQSGSAAAPFDRIDITVTGRCAALRASADAQVTVERRYLRRGRRVAEPRDRAEPLAQEAASIASLLCSGFVGPRGFRSVEAAMASPEGRDPPEPMAAYRSQEAELTGTVIQGFEMNAVVLCGSEAGCVDDAPAETCWLNGNIQVPVPPGAPEWIGNSPRRDSADYVFRGTIERALLGQGFGHMGAFRCQVTPSGPARPISITQRRPPRPDPFAPARRPETAAANAALTAMIAGAGTVRLGAGTQSWDFNAVTPGSSDMHGPCYSSARFNGAWLENRAPGINWSETRSVSRAGATVTVAQVGYDENLTFVENTPADARRMKAFADRLAGRHPTAVEQQGRRVTIGFAAGGAETVTFADAGRAIEAAGMAERLTGREIATITQDTNRLHARPLERVTLTFDSEAKAAEAERLMEALRTACAPAPGS